MAREIERWVTINGHKVPIYKDGGMGGFMEGKSYEPKKDSDNKTDKDFMEKENQKWEKEHGEWKDHAQGKNYQELVDKLKEGGFELESADAHDIQNSKSFNDEKVTLYDKDGTVYEGTYNRYNDGGREVVDIKPKKNYLNFEQAKKEGRIDKDAEYEDFVSYAPIKDDPNYEKKRIARETADENDAYDRAHNEGKYADQIGTGTLADRDRRVKEKMKQWMEKNYPGKTEDEIDAGNYMVREMKFLEEENSTRREMQGGYMDWNKPLSSAKSNTSENTMANRNALKKEIDDYVKAHPEPTAEDRQKVSEMRDRYNAMKKEAYEPSRQAQKEREQIINDVKKNTIGRKQAIKDIYYEQELELHEKAKSNTSGINNDYESRYGLKNVGELKSFTGIGGSIMVGTVEPKVNDVQEYFNTGAFDNYGTNARAKKDIAKKIADDMHRRGYDITVSEDGTKWYPAGETGKTISFGRDKDGNWVAKESKSAGLVRKTGMKKALDTTSQKKIKIGDREVSVNKNTLSPMAQAQQMSEKELRAYVNKNGLTKSYNMMMNTRSGGYDYNKQMRVLRDLVADEIAKKEGRKKK